jgi:hypothetical protein
MSTPLRSPLPLLSLFRSGFSGVNFSKATRVRLALVLGGLLFFVYAAFRQRYIFGVDSFGYYQLGQLFSEGSVFLPTRLPAVGQPALAPMGFSLNYAGHVVPNYPPGFPLFIAVGHLLRMPMLVTPFLGVVSCGLLYLLIRARAAASTALLFAWAWAFMPLTVFGSTMMMSDLVAATTIMAAVLAWRTQRVVLAAWMLGLSFAIRPSNVLIVVPFAMLLRPDRASLRLILHLAAPCALYALYNYFLYGAPWRTGYGDFSNDLNSALFPTHFAFYLRTTWVVLSPVIVLLAAIGLFPWSREKLFLVACPFVFMAFFANWASGGIDRWWWARFILPAYPAVFLLAAEGFETVRRRLAAGSGTVSRFRTAGIAVLHLLILALPLYYVVYGVQRGDLWKRDSGVPNHDVALRVSARVPAGSLVGTVEFTSTFTVYTEITPFISILEEAPELVGKALASGRHVYLLVEPWYLKHPVIADMLQRYHAREIERYPNLWHGLPLYELTLQ